MQVGLSPRAFWAMCWVGRSGPEGSTLKITSCTAGHSMRVAICKRLRGEQTWSNIIRVRCALEAHRNAVRDVVAKLAWSLKLFVRKFCRTLNTLWSFSTASRSATKVDLLRFTRLCVCGADHWWRCRVFIVNELWVMQYCISLLDSQKEKINR